MQLQRPVGRFRRGGPFGLHAILSDQPGWSLPLNLAVAANGRPTVKLSDNPNKAMGPKDEIARYKRVFEVGEQERVEVVV